MDRLIIVAQYSGEWIARYEGTVRYPEWPIGRGANQAEALADLAARLAAAPPPPLPERPRRDDRIDAAPRPPTIHFETRDECEGVIVRGRVPRECEGVIVRGHVRVPRVL